MQTDTEALKRAITEGMKTMLTEIERLEHNAAVSGTGAKQRGASKKNATTTLEWQPNAKPGKIKVNQLPALYALADAQLLHLVYAMMPDADYPGTYVYMVKDTPQVRNVLLPFLGKESTTAKKG